MSEYGEFGSEFNNESFPAKDDTLSSQSGGRRSLRDFPSRTADLIQDNPIVAGFAALAVGALIGALIPESDREHELMGSTRDRLAGRAREMARDGVSRARDMAVNAGRAATDAVKNGDAGRNADSTKKTDVGQTVGLGGPNETIL